MPTALAPGQLVDERYTLHHELHEDAFGTVWEAFDRGLGRRVCLRDVTFPGEDPPEAKLREALKTARLAIRVDHPGAIHVYDAFLDGDRLVVVTELTSTRSLEDVVIRKRPLAPKRVAAIALELLEPLSAAHALGITHGSINPSAVLLPDKARSLLTGFGLAPPLTAAGYGVQAAPARDLAWAEAIGDPACTAPEQVAGTGTTAATDMWSLGATLYFATEGEHAFAADTPAATFAAIANDPPQPASRAGALGPVLERLLAKDPEARPALDDLRRDLVEVAGIPLPVEGAVPVDVRRRRWGRRRPVAGPETPTDVEATENELADVDTVADAVADAATVPEDEHDWDAVVREPDRADPWVEWSPDADADPIADADVDVVADAVAEVDQPPSAEVAPSDVGPEGASEPATGTTVEEEPEPKYRASPSWPPAHQRRSYFIVILCVWVIVVMAGLLITNGQFFQPDASEDASGETRPVLSTDPDSVPSNWIAYRHSAVDFAISYPPGWRVREDGPLLVITDPASGTELRVDARTPGPDPEQVALETERHFSQRHPDDYRRMQMSPALYLDHPAALWEYTYAEGATTFRAAELDFSTKKYLFSMRFHALGGQWDDMFPLFRGFLSSVDAPK